MVNKKTFIQNFTVTPFNSEERALYTAFIECLASDEACDLLLKDYEMPYLDRLIWLKKIGRDMEQNFEECHENLISDLIEILSNADKQQLQSCATCLSYLYDFATKPYQDLILRAFLLSEYRSLRKRACKKLRKQFDTSNINLVNDAWKKFGDAEVAEIIVKYFDVDFLEDNFYSLSQGVVNTWYFTMLFIRIGEIKPSLLKLLEEFDAVTYAYVLVKLGKKLTSAKAFQIYEEYKCDKRIGLLIWCYGRMKLWNALLKINNQEDRDFNCKKCGQGTISSFDKIQEEVEFGEITLIKTSDLYLCNNCGENL